MDRTKFLDENGRKVVVGLFEEFDRPDRKFRPITKLADWKSVYLDSMDPSEYRVAMTLVGDWEHWQLIRNHPFIKPVMDKWAEELEVKMTSEAISRMRHHATQQGGAASAKWLAEKGYATQPKKKVGRPSTKEETKPEDSIEEDAARLGLKLVGGK
jgi:hypothetical protein